MTPFRRFLRAATAGCALVFAGACALGGPSPSAGPPPRAWTAQSPPWEVAAWVLQGCRRAAGGKDACVERTLTALVDQAGIATSLQVLDTLAAMDRGVRDSGHALAHGLGISAYRSPETLDATLAACPMLQMSGCFHGVIQGYFLDLARRGQPVGAAELDALCAPHEGREFIHFHCAHGIGHGLMALHGNHLPRALEACDRVSRGFVRESCYGGAFMENVMQVTHPHHTAEGHARTQAEEAADAHAGHGGHAGGGDDAHAAHGSAEGARGAWRALDPDDPLYPCTAVEPKYQAACYGFQPSAVMFFNAGDAAATARACERAPEAFRAICFGSLGREVTTWAGQDYARTLAMCGEVADAGGGRARAWCVRGAVETLVNQSAEPRRGLRFCRAVQDAEVKDGCYERVGELILALRADADARAAQCSAAEPEFVAACRRGARLDGPARRTGT